MLWIYRIKLSEHMKENNKSNMLADGLVIFFFFFLIMPNIKINLLWEKIEMWIKVWYIYIKDMFNSWRGYVIRK